MRIIIADETKKRERQKLLRLKRIDDKNYTEQFSKPDEIKTVKLYSLTERRNAWQGIERYYSEYKINFDLEGIKSIAERERLRGSSFIIFPKEAIWFKYKENNLLLIELTNPNQGWYEEALQKIAINDLKMFWNSDKFFHSRIYPYQENNFAKWLYLYRVNEWRPDLVENVEPKSFTSHIIGSKKKMGWTEKTITLSNNFNKFANNLIVKYYGNQR